MPGKAEHSRTFRLTPEDMRVLRECAERAESTEVAAVRVALRLYLRRLKHETRAAEKISGNGA